MSHQLHPLNKHVLLGLLQKCNILKECVFVREGDEKEPFVVVAVVDLSFECI